MDFFLVTFTLSLRPGGRKRSVIVEANGFDEAASRVRICPMQDDVTPNILSVAVAPPAMLNTIYNVRESMNKGLMSFDVRAPR